MTWRDVLISVLLIICGILVSLIMILISVESEKDLDYLENDPLLKYAYIDNFTHIVYINKENCFCPFLDEDGNYVKYKDGHYESVRD